MCQMVISKNQSVPVGRHAGSTETRFAALTTVNTSKSSDLTFPLYSSLVRSMGIQSHAERSSWCVHKSSPCFYVFDPRATESLLDAAFSLNPLRISQNRTVTRVPFLRFLTFIDQPLDSARFAPSRSKSASNLSPHVNGSHVCRQLPSYPI